MLIAEHLRLILPLCPGAAIASLVAFVMRNFTVVLAVTFVSARLSVGCPIRSSQGHRSGHFKPNTSHRRVVILGLDSIGGFPIYSRHHGSLTISMFDALDHDVSGFDEGGGGIPFLQVEFSCCFRGDDACDLLFTNSDDDLCKQAFDADTDDLAKELIASADAAEALA